MSECANNQCAYRPRIHFESLKSYAHGPPVKCSVEELFSLPLRKKRRITFFVLTTKSCTRVNLFFDVNPYTPSNPVMIVTGIDCELEDIVKQQSVLLVYDVLLKKRLITCHYVRMGRDTDVLAICAYKGARVA